nr:phage holin family protein [Brevibacillus brevis]
MGAISVQATIQGILAAGIATLGHQLWKQTFVKKRNRHRGQRSHADYGVCRIDPN